LAILYILCVKFIHSGGHYVAGGSIGERL